MKFSSGFFGAFFTSGGQWELTLAPQALEYANQGGKAERLPYESIRTIVVVPGVIWAKITVNSSSGLLRVDGVVNATAAYLASSLRRRVADALLAILNSNQNVIEDVARELQSLFERPCYLAQHDTALCVDHLKSKYGEVLLTILSAVEESLFPTSRLSPQLCTQINLIKSVLARESQDIERRNEQFIIAELEKCREFFRKVETTPLTEEQRRAAIIMEDRNLLVAAAGSGKTSTIVGKVGYAVLRHYATPEQILVLAFNAHAAEELSQRIADRLKDELHGKSVKVKTFHALGLEIIAEVENAKPTVAGFLTNQVNGVQSLIATAIEELLFSDEDFTQAWVQFNAIYFRPARDPVTFESIDEWKEYVKETGDYVNGKNGYQTLNGELVKSQGEQAIANWLFTHGVNYEYERAYKYQTVTKQYRRYHPDFYLPDIDTYLEHYALDKNGEPPKIFGERYRESLAWKRALHESKGTAVIETFFAEFVAGELFPKLERELRARSIRFTPRGTTEILGYINERQGRMASEFENLIQTIIKHAKSNQFSVEELEKRAKDHQQPARAVLFMRLFGKLFDKYEQALVREGAIDFEDMIVKASQYAASGRYRHQNRLILVDEFQDISRPRAALLQGLLRHAPDCKLFSVGDDWQAIYRFAGSDISVFTEYAQWFGCTKTSFLTQTFRSNQGIADVASWFVQKNGAQIRKAVKASDGLRDGVLVIRSVQSGEHEPAEVLRCLRDIEQDAKQAGVRKSVHILGRYRYLKPTALGRWMREFSNHLDIEFRTVHSAKGLQADYVIVLGLRGGKMGFPSQIADDPLLKLVMPSVEAYPYAEERRLFYVALTRARNRVYLISHRYLRSKFVEELMGVEASEFEAILRGTPRDSSNDTSGQICPRCGKGQLRLLSGRYGKFYGCSEHPRCKFTRNLSTVQKLNGKKSAIQRAKGS